MADTQPQPTGGRRKKHFVPLESNPEVMTALIHRLGLPSTLAFHDVFSITEPELLEFVPRPVHALLFVFPVSKLYEDFRRDEDAQRAEYTGSGEGEDVVWYKQTISNACGLIGVLHAVSNGAARGMVREGSDLDKLVKAAVPLGVQERAELVEESEALESAHSAAASTGVSAAPNATDDVDLHFVTFVKSEKNGHLYEMDGRRKGPIDRGGLEEGEDVLSERALEMGAKKFLERELKGGDIRFGILALAESFGFDD